MRVYLDDERPAPEGWTLVKTTAEAVCMLLTYDVVTLSLDHDLGDSPYVGNGYDVLLWIEEQVALNGFEPPLIFIHSANAGARPKMEAAVKSIYNIYSQVKHGKSK